MSADDDKVSGNRRRLFKALSTAPVVMTLRPGEALANNSTFQCAEKIADPNVSPNLEVYGPVPTPGFVTLTYDYFKLEDVPLNCALQITDDFVVAIDEALYGNLNPGVAITNGFIYDPGPGGAGSGTGTLTLLDGNAQPCGDPLPAIVGEFALLDSLADDGLFTGVAWPKANPNNPELQGITGTCMASINGMPTLQSLL
jgi:hypothetical protein